MGVRCNGKKGIWQLMERGGRGSAKKSRLCEKIDVFFFCLFFAFVAFCFFPFFAVRLRGLFHVGERKSWAIGARQSGSCKYPNANLSMNKRKWEEKKS